MDYQEVIEMFKRDGAALAKRGHWNMAERYQCAIDAMKELQLYKENKLCLIPDNVFKKQCEELDEYKALGTLEEVKEAVEKQKAKKPNWHINPIIEKGKLPVCPTCNTIMVRTEILGRTIDEHCVMCGQFIDWSE